MIFYGADLASESEGPPTPEMGYIYRVAPPTAPSEVLAADPGLLFPAAWLDDTQVVVNFTSGGNWGVAIVALDGSWQALESAPNAVFVDVLPE
jgi:hypothetical protein